MFFVCFLSSFVALVYWQNGLIFKNVIKAEKLMATGSSVRAMTFSAGVTWWAGQNFVLKISPS